MALYAMGDFHLAHTVDKPMDIFGPEWDNHMEKIRKNCVEIIKPNDILVIPGDHSWGTRLENCMDDLDFIANLPGKKVLLRGNHDLFWPASKTATLNKLFDGQLVFLQNNYFAYKNYAIVGTKGCVNGWENNEEHYLKLLHREVRRLEISFEKAVEDRYQQFIMFLHYPPTSIGEMDSPFTRLAEKYHAEQVVYAHCHGEHYNDSIQGYKNGVLYRLVSSDYVGFKPVLLLP